MTPFRVSHSLTDNQVKEADIHEVRQFWGHGIYPDVFYYTVGPARDKAMLHPTPNQAYEALNARNYDTAF